MARATMMDEKPRLLFLCQTLPFPPDGGVEIRTYNILRLLARDFRITVLCFYRRETKGGPGQVESAKAGLAGLADVEVFPIPQEHSRSRLVWDHLRSLVRRRAYTRYAYGSRAFRARLERLLATESFDLIHVDSLDLSGYFPLRTNAPVVCTHQNVESDLLFRRSAAETSPIMRHYARFQARRTLEEERRWMRSVALNIAVSEEDARRLAEIDPSARIAVVPNGVDTSAFRPTAGPRSGVVFVGGHGWYPNRDGMTYFRDEVLPLVRDRIPDVTVTWVGRAPAAARDEYGAHGIELTGHVPDIRPYVDRAACFVVPIRVGGGSRLKILDAWALGKAIVSSSVGCEGLDARDGENIMIRDTPDGFADAVVAVLRDAPLQERLGEAGRRTAEARYDWGVIGAILRRELAALRETQLRSAPPNHAALTGPGRRAEPRGERREGRRNV